jgi:small conductance mechanosensitive channel
LVKLANICSPVKLLSAKCHVMPLAADIAQSLTNALGKVSDATGTGRVTDLAGKASNYLADHSRQFIAGTIVVVIGIVASSWIARALSWLLERRNLDPPERLLIIMVARLLLLGLTVMAALDVCGFKLGAVIAGVGVLSVGVGFAMQGLLGNIIAGATLIFTKPFRVGEYIEILGVQGLVSHMDILSTTLMHTDQSKVVIPNHKIMGEILHNIGSTRQIRLSIGVGYRTDLPRARELILQVLGASPRVVPTPKPMVGVEALRESAIALFVRFWVKVGDYELAEAELYEAIVECFRRHQVEIPYPRHEIHLIQPSTASQIPSP